MSKAVKLVEVLRLVTAQHKLPLINAEVKSVQGDVCTVDVGGLEVTDVRLKATIGATGDGLLVTPKIGSMVLVGSLTGDLKDLAVLQMDRMEKLEYAQNGLTLEVESATGKVQVKNNATSLKEILQALADLLKQFKVTTPSGPSTAVIPDTLTAIIQFENKFKALLK